MGLTRADEAIRSRPLGPQTTSWSPILASFEPKKFSPRPRLGGGPETFNFRLLAGRDQICSPLLGPTPPGRDPIAEGRRLLLDRLQLQLNGPKSSLNLPGALHFRWRTSDRLARRARHLACRARRGHLGPAGRDLSWSAVGSLRLIASPGREAARTNRIESSQAAGMVGRPGRSAYGAACPTSSRRNPPRPASRFSRLQPAK